MGITLTWKLREEQIIRGGQNMKKLVLIIFISLLCIICAFPQYPRDQKIIDAEYFLNTDPGEGNGIVIDIGGMPLWETTVNIQNMDVPIGSNIYVRFKSTNGKWSAPRCIMRKEYFSNSGATLSYWECFINIDPGLGNGIPITFQNGIANINGLDLIRGDRVNVRIKDSYNRWSPARPVQFNFKEIEKAEYYIQYGAGGSSTINNMNLSPYNPYSSTYIANAYNIDDHPFDTAVIRFQTKDKFYSLWVKRRVDNVGIEEKPFNPFHFVNYPNPFLERTTFSFEIPDKSNVNLRIIDVTGKLEQIIVNDELTKGVHEINYDGFGLAPGIYFGILTINGILQTIKICKQ